MKERSVLYVGLAGLVVSAASWGQQLQTGDEQRTQPPAAWERVNERKVSLPAGTMLAVRLTDHVSSDKSQAGDRFEGTLDTPIVVGGKVVADKGSSVVGRVARVRKAGRMTAPSELVLELVELVCPTGRVAIQTDPIERRGETSSHTGDEWQSGARQRWAQRWERSSAVARAPRSGLPPEAPWVPEEHSVRRGKQRR